MKNVTNPKVKLLASGSKLVAKQMQANAGDLLPMHEANLESILFIHQGECILHINNEEKQLKPGDAIIIPQDVKHQIMVKSDLKGIHFMPKEIEFQFFK